MTSYTKIPNDIARNKYKLNVYERSLLIYLMSYNPCFPSYNKIQADLAMARATLAKTIDTLVQKGFMQYKKGNRQGKANEYFVYETPWNNADANSTTFNDEVPENVVSGSSPDELALVHEMNYPSSPDELALVHDVNSNKTNSNKTNVIQTNSNKSVCVYTKLVCETEKKHTQGSGNPELNLKSNIESLDNITLKKAGQGSNNQYCVEHSEYTSSLASNKDSMHNVDRVVNHRSLEEPPPNYRDTPPIDRAAVLRCVEEWKATTRHFSTIGTLQDEIHIARLVQRHGEELTRYAIIGARFEKASDNFDPADHVSIMRLSKSHIFDKLVKLGARQAKPKTIHEVYE